MAAITPRVGADMLPSEHKDFCAYADSLHLNDSALANLLIVRELQQRRLGRLKDLYFKEVPKIGSARITAYQASKSVKLAFATHAGAHGLKSGPAAAIIYRAELAEQWLKRSILAENQESF